MVEDSRREDHALKSKDCCKRNFEQHDGHDARKGGEDDFTDVKSAGGCRIEKLVEMVNAVKAPEQRYFVVRAVPPVDPEIEQKEVENKAAPSREPVRPESNRLIACPYRDRNNDQWAAGRIDEPKAAVAHEARGVADALPKTRSGNHSFEPVPLRGGPNPLKDKECD